MSDRHRVVAVVDNEGRLTAVFSDKALAQEYIQRESMTLHHADTWAVDANAPVPAVPPPTERPRIVCLSGSTRYLDVMAVEAWELEKRGNIALSCHLLPSWYTEAEHHLAEEQGVADALDALHLRKIDMADEVLVINVNDYIGASTSREIAYAERTGKPVRYLYPHPTEGQR